MCREDALRIRDITTLSVYKNCRKLQQFIRYDPSQVDKNPFANIGGSSSQVNIVRDLFGLPRVGEL
jgi:hypothetical protein